MRPRAIILRHNGIGDLVMAAPWIVLMAEKHSLTIEAEAGNHKWLNWVFPMVSLRNCSCDPFNDHRTRIDDFDISVNLNRIEEIDASRLSLGIVPINFQDMYSVMFTAAGTPPPSDGMAPSLRTKGRIAPPSGRVLIFTKSTHPSRALSEGMNSLITETLSKYETQYHINPQYRSRLSLFENVASASAVIGGDSGAIHIAELLHVPWLCLHTTFNCDLRHKYYKMGSCLQSMKKCSPCYCHGGCEKMDCTGMFNEEEVKDSIRKLIGK